MANSNGRAIPVRPCPICRGDAIAHGVTRSGQDRVLTYRCGLCGHLWNVVARRRDGPIVWHD